MAGVKTLEAARVELADCALQSAIALVRALDAVGLPREACLRPAAIAELSRLVRDLRAEELERQETRARALDIQPATPTPALHPLPPVSDPSTAWTDGGAGAQAVRS